MGFCSDLAALLCGFEAEGANEGIEIIDNPLTEAINFRSLVGAEKDRGECRVDLLYLLAKLKNACGEFYATDKAGTRIELFVDPTNGAVVGKL